MLNLTPRESQVAELIARGLSNREIAYELEISVETVKTHVGRIYAQLDVHNHVELTRLLLDDEEF